MLLRDMQEVPNLSSTGTEVTAPGEQNTKEGQRTMGFGSCCF